MGDGLVGELFERFKTHYTGPPPWAWPYRPSIPLIGEGYVPGKSLLVYASAENLSWMNDNRVPARFTDIQWSGYRALFSSMWGAE